jgi:electron transfer flavoprotein alpha subunit
MGKCAVLIYHQQEEKTRGLIPWGRALADKLGGTLGILVAASNIAREKVNVQQLGGDTVYYVDGLTSRPFPEIISQIIAKAAEKYDPKVILCAATKLGNEVAARAAEKLNAGCITECRYVDIDSENKLLAKRTLYGGAAIGTFAVQTRTSICTISLNVLTIENGAGKAGKYDSRLIGLEISLDQIPKEIVEVKPIKKTIDLSKTKRIVAMGRGIAKKQDISLVENLAKALDAEIGCSRPIAEELKWLPDERKVGITGITVKPDIYIALGISGQVQHMVGMKESKVIVAINSNKSAPIFQVADYSIVGDLYKVIPELIRKLERN